MAKKLRKVRISRRLLLIEFLIPWAVMGIVALTGYYLGLGEIGITVSALACALTATLIIRLLEQRRRRIQASKP